MPFRPDKLTVKSQEALQGAQQLAERKGNPQLVPLHLLRALIEEPDGIPRAILQKVGVAMISQTPQVVPADHLREGLKVNPGVGLKVWVIKD